jgi:hypothetical protein
MCSSPSKRQAAIFRCTSSTSLVVLTPNSSKIFKQTIICANADESNNSSSHAFSVVPRNSVINFAFDQFFGACSTTAAKHCSPCPIILMEVKLPVNHENQFWKLTVEIVPSYGPPPTYGNFPGSNPPPGMVPPGMAPPGLGMFAMPFNIDYTSKANDL